MTFIDFDGNERTEDFYFNLNKAEVLELEMGITGGMSQMLKNIVAAKDSKQIVDTFKRIVLLAYGKKSPDGREFIKSPEISKSFEQTEAYSDLFVELATNAEIAATFINGILPQETNKEASSASLPTLTVNT